MRRTINNFAGCLLGGAIGDALGSPVELNTYEEIISKYGPQGIEDLQYNSQGIAEVTDDTQLTLFTAEGLLRAKCRQEQRKLKKDPRETTRVVFRAYLRWLYTQGLFTTNWRGKDYDGWLVAAKPLYESKQASTVTIATLGKGIMGRLSKPINHSKTSGSVIRVAPVGLFASKDDAFDLGARVGAITHGHPSAYYSAGAMALLISNITSGMSIMEGLLDVIQELKNHDHSHECIEKLNQAIALFKTQPRSKEALLELGTGREATQALAMGLYCALSYPEDLIEALKLAVNHRGDSGSTGSITGSIIGVYLGKEAIPTKWLTNLQLGKEINIIAKDLYTQYCGADEWVQRYPGW